MLRETIVAEVARILHGPINGSGEQLEKNPLDFYSVGVLFPQLPLTKEYEEQDDNSVGTGAQMQQENAGENTSGEEKSTTQKVRASQEADTTDKSGELELTTKFRPSAAGISVLTAKNASLEINIRFAVYVKKKAEKEVVKGEAVTMVSVNVYKHVPHEFTLKIKGDTFDFGDLNYSKNGNLINVNLNENAILTIATRNYPHKYGQEALEIKTFTLINKKEAKSSGHQKSADDCLFQPSLTVQTTNGFKAFDDRTDLNILSEEDLNLKLLYRNYKVYAQGHGISVDWDEENDQVQKVFTQVLPQEKVNGVDLNPDVFKGSNILYIKRLSGTALEMSYDWTTVKSELEVFIDLYKQWIVDQGEQIKNNGLEPKLKEQAVKNLKKCEKLYERMKKGIELLAADSEARKAFEDANRAMFMQRVMADFSRHRRVAGRVQKNNAGTDDGLPDYTKIPFDAGAGKIWQEGELHIDLINYEKTGTLARWRPFQLAFLLSQVQGITDPSSPDRDTVDLIWFPTGGGKTEAYLGLTAFTIFFRRLKARKSYNDPDQGAGVSVLMRYTLRLLNKQQFERATILICSCDLIRRMEPAAYGKVRISNGIWMGRSMTPNNEEDQQRDYADYIRQVNRGRQPSTYKSSPPLLSCPCCGNRLVREIENNQVIGRWGYFRTVNNRGSETGRYHMACTNTRCAFYVTAADFRKNPDKTFPVYEVDETIYQERPSLLFSTVDKFVQLAWRSDAFNLFNTEFSNNQVKRLYPSPELIIQDELHLISSALGTIYGVYEIVIDRLCREAEGNICKVVGATATVRNAEEQCRRLYGRKHFLQFPPPATDADDSFYAKKIKVDDPKNRLYVGFMPSGVTTSTALIRLASVLLERIPVLPAANGELDRYYTLVVYFNALKELGKFRTFLTDDIVAYRKMLANHFSTFFKPFNQNALCELSSVMTADDINKGLDRLEKTTLPAGLDENNLLVQKLFATGIRTNGDIKTAKGSVWSGFLNKPFFDQIDLAFSGDSEKDYKSFINAVNNLMGGHPDPVQIAPATNMISVGVDIPRLNTMIVNGQPKTTAEYIQASSRVGREGPGVVFTFLAPTKNRDRSHYEQFKAFHQAYYYHVEASSVTPFSRPALEKVLPTVLITLTRSLFLTGSHGVFSPADTAYRTFVDGVIQDVKAKAIAIYGAADATEICDTIDSIQQEFTTRLSMLDGDRRLAVYTDYMRYDPNIEQVVTKIRNPNAVYNAPAQFVESLLQDHIPTMQTLRNVESSSKVRIKSI
ncbi:helicase-related protein [Aridibaculum aurantiacum]|uniref:helicase-related protein n=1 Tax=Aridibaculum aurantiacum TaxID=2810307 RepID=UPI001A96033D|nr:helicase-related protein [Aridibaculum aurantiacum]